MWSTATTFIGRWCSRISRLAATLRLGLALPDQLVAAQVRVLGEAAEPGKPEVSSSTHCGRPHALGDLGAVVGGHQHLVAHLRRELARIEVEQPAVPVEATAQSMPIGPYYVP